MPALVSSSENVCNLLPPECCVLCGKVGGKGMALFCLFVFVFSVMVRA